MKQFKSITFYFIFFPFLFSYAQWSGDTTLNNPICTTLDYQINPISVTDASGGAIIAWKDERSTPYGYAIYIQKIDSNGTIQWTNNGIAIVTGLEDNKEPTLIADGAGGAIITWEYRQVNGDFNIYAQRINSNGAKIWGTNGVLICNANNDQIHPNLVSDLNGGAIIAWTDNRNISTTDSDIFVQKINSTGTMQLATDGIPISTAVNAQYKPLLVSDGNGGAILTWLDERNRFGPPGSSIKLYTQRINSDGLLQLTTNGIFIMFHNAIVPEIITDNNGGAILVWESINNPQFFITLLAQRIGQTGAKLWTDSGVIIDSYATFDRKKPRVISDNSGGAIITWYETRSTTDWDIYAQKINELGATQWSTNGVVVSEAIDRQDTPTIATDGNGGAIITWEDRRSGTTFIFAQKINDSGIVQWTSNGLLVSNKSPYGFGPEIISNNEGGAIITWTSGSLDGDIYAQQVNSSGSLSINTQDNALVELKVFPNPAINSITFQSKSSISEIKICNEIGQVVYDEMAIKANIKEINLSILPVGIYYYLITSDDFLKSNGKIIVH